jgi:uncharacterized membrane protein
VADIARADASAGVAFLVSAGVVYEIIAAACSSPQTCEINASTRAGTLMKWVHIGLVQAAVLVVVAAWLDQARRGPILAGGTAAGVIMYGSYLYARACGLRNPGPGTEGQQTRPAGLRWA